MQFTLREIAALLGGKVEGDPETPIHDLSKIENGRSGTITFLANPKYTPHIYTTHAAAVLVADNFQPTAPVPCALVRVKDPYVAFTILLEKISELIRNKIGIEEGALIHPQAVIGQDVYIGAGACIAAGARIGDQARIYPGAYIGDNAEIGSGTVIYANVSVYYGCKIGSNGIIHSGTVIGSDGFGFAPQADGSLKKIPQTGIVLIEDNVEIGANCTIDRATLGATIIRKGAKLDNLIQVAHNVEIGENTVIAAQTGVSGTTRIGRGCMIGGQVGIVGHIQLADGTRVGAQSGISKSVTQPGRILRGSPAQEFQKQLRSEALFRQLDEMAKKIATLEQILQEKEH